MNKLSNYCTTHNPIQMGRNYIYVGKNIKWGGGGNLIQENIFITSYSNSQCWIRILYVMNIFRVWSFGNKLELYTSVSFDWSQCSLHNFLIIAICNLSRLSVEYLKKYPKCLTYCKVFIWSSNFQKKKKIHSNDCSNIAIF